MDYLWSPWRYAYVSTAGPTDRCIFCEAVSANNDSETLIVHRARHCYAILNRFPYTSGHLMVAPYAHVATLEDLADCYRRSAADGAGPVVVAVSESDFEAFVSRP